MRRTRGRKIKERTGKRARISNGKELVFVAKDLKRLGLTSRRNKKVQSTEQRLVGINRMPVVFARAIGIYFGIETMVLYHMGTALHRVQTGGNLVSS